MASEKSIELNEKLADLLDRKAVLAMTMSEFGEIYDDIVNIQHYILNPHELARMFETVPPFWNQLSDEHRAIADEYINNSNEINKIRQQIKLFKEADDVRSGKFLTAGAVISQANPQNIQEVYAGQLGAIEKYYETALSQSDRSFRWALVATGIGLAFFIFAIIFLLFNNLQEVAIVSVIGGAITEFIAGINFYLYGKTSQQLSEFRAGLERTSRYLLANSVALNIEHGSEAQAEAMKELVRLVATRSISDIKTS